MHFANDGRTPFIGNALQNSGGGGAGSSRLPNIGRSRRDFGLGSGENEDNKGPPNVIIPPNTTDEQEETAGENLAPPTLVPPTLQREGATVVPPTLEMARAEGSTVAEEAELLTEPRSNPPAPRAIGNPDPSPSGAAPYGVNSTNRIQAPRRLPSQLADDSIGGQELSEATLAVNEIGATSIGDIIPTRSTRNIRARLPSETNILRENTLTNNFRGQVRLTGFDGKANYERAFGNQRGLFVNNMPAQIYPQGTRPMTTQERFTAASEGRTLEGGLGSVSTEMQPVAAASTATSEGYAVSGAAEAAGDFGVAEGLEDLAVLAL